MAAPQFLFATGIENSYPTIGHGKVRQDELEKCGHYKFWKKDFDLMQELGITFLRYGPPIHTTWLGPGKYDWSFADETFNDLHRRNLMPIVDLCHFGVPDWVGNFQNPDFPQLFAQYAGDFARRFPWVQLYTPVNEMYVCAKFSGLYGWWNEQLASDQAPMLWNNPNVKSGVEKINPSDVGQPSDLAAAIAYLASDDAKFIQGAELRVDGGRLDHL